VREPDERLTRPGQGPLELPERRTLEAVGVGPRFEHRHHVVGVVRARVGHDPRPGQQVSDLPGRGDAVEHRHVYVHQDDVRVDRRGDRDRVLAVFRLADNLDLGLPCQADLQGLARVGRVVADQETKHRPPQTSAAFKTGGKFGTSALSV
jgi:hypothetical protein